MIPARSVGGDFFDFIQLGESLLAIAIGDVSDKGVPAALFMAMVRSLLRAETHPGRSLQRVLRSVNRHLMDMNDKEMFVAILFDSGCWIAAQPTSFNMCVRATKLQFFSKPKVPTTKGRPKKKARPIPP